MGRCLLRTSINQKAGFAESLANSAVNYGTEEGGGEKELYGERKPREMTVPICASVGTLDSEWHPTLGFR
jgi:hypothetical protein